MDLNLVQWQFWTHHIKESGSFNFIWMAKSIPQILASTHLLLWTLLKPGHAITPHLKRAAHGPLHLQGLSWPWDTHRCCCVFCLCQGCLQSYCLPQELLPGQLSAGTEMENETGSARKRDWWSETKPQQGSLGNAALKWCQSRAESA